MGSDRMWREQDMKAGGEAGTKAWDHPGTKAWDHPVTSAPKASPGRDR